MKYYAVASIGVSVGLFRSMTPCNMAWLFQMYTYDSDLLCLKQKWSLSILIGKSSLEHVSSWSILYHFDLFLLVHLHHRTFVILLSPP